MQPPTPDAYQPRLTRWTHTWRLLAAIAISALAWSSVWTHQWQQTRVLFWVDLGLGLASVPLVLVRRRYPLAVPVVLAVMSSVSASAIGPGVLAGVSLATRRHLPQILLVGVVSVLSGAVFSATQQNYLPTPLWAQVIVSVAVTVATLAIGMYVGSRRELLWTLQDRAERAEGEQELRVREARSKERSRIAREMHDVLAHRISLVSMHAGALAYRTDLTEQEAGQSARIIQQNAHQALVDLRQVLGVLREDREDSDAAHFTDRPQPTYGDIAGLVEEAVAAGTAVKYDAAVAQAAEMPEQVGRTVYRIIQEALTNVRKHAPGVTVTVRLTGSPGEGVDVVVRNPTRLGQVSLTPGAGLGLVGLTERTELTGGRLVHTVDRESFTLHGWLPWRQ